MYFRDCDNTKDVLPIFNGETSTMHEGRVCSVLESEYHVYANSKKYPSHTKHTGKLILYMPNKILRSVK